ncbi:Proteasome subunit alpha [Mycobacterium tuberculosis]|nr:Proteasome subunit alpha [Mycobacterium tuberculosis]
MVMGGTTEPIANALKESYAENATANRRAESESPTRVWDPAATLTAPNPGSTRRRPS